MSNWPPYLWRSAYVFCHSLPSEVFLYIYDSQLVLIYMAESFINKEGGTSIDLDAGTPDNK